MKRKREWLAQRRKMAGHSQEQLAEVLGVDRSTVVRWERGETEPQPWQRARLAKALGISGEFLAELLADVVTDRRDGADRLDRALAQPIGVDAEVARGLQEQVRQVASAYETTPSAALLVDAGRCHAAAEFLLPHASTEPVRGELHAAAIESATLLSQHRLGCVAAP